jgi:hypothetical protein
LEAPNDRTGPSREEGRGVPGLGPAGRRVAARREGDGDTGELAVAEGAIDGAAVAMDDAQARSVKPERNEAPMSRTPRPNSEPAGVAEKGVGDDASGLRVMLGAKLADSVRRRTYVLIHAHAAGAG